MPPFITELTPSASDISLQNEVAASVAIEPIVFFLLTLIVFNVLKNKKHIWLNRTTTHAKNSFLSIASI